MSDELHPSFRTKTGVCTITPEHIVLSREGLRGRAAELISGQGSMAARLALYAVLGIVLLAIGVYFLSRQAYINSIFPVLVGVLLLASVVRSRNYTATSVIPRSAIQSITATKPIPAATRAHFTVQFVQNQRSVNRIIILPGILQGGKTEFDKALSVFRECGLHVSM